MKGIEGIIKTAMNRLSILRTLMPSTARLLVDIYGSEQAYVEHHDQTVNAYRKLEEACMMYEMSFYFAPLAVNALALLGVRGVCTLSGGCRGAAYCTCGCPGGTCGEDPTVRLFNVLTRISKSREEMGKHLV